MTTAVLRFFRGRKGNIISKLPDGRIAIVDRRATNRPKPREKWVCRIVVEKPNYAIVEPIERVVCKKVRVIKKFSCGHTIETTAEMDFPESCKEVVKEVDVLCDECYKMASEAEHRWDKECLKVFFSEFNIPSVFIPRDNLKELEKELKHCEEELKKRIEDIRKNARIVREWREEKPICIEYSGFFNDDDYREVKATVIMSEVEYNVLREVVEVYSDAYSKEKVIEKFIEKIKEKLPEYKKYKEIEDKYYDMKWSTDAYEDSELTNKALMDKTWRNLYEWLRDPSTEIGDRLYEAFEKAHKFALKLKEQCPFAEIPDTYESVKRYIREALLYEATPVSDWSHEISEDEWRSLFAKIIRLAKEQSRKTF